MTHLMQSEVALQQQQTQYKELAARVDALSRAPESFLTTSAVAVAALSANGASQV